MGEGVTGYDKPTLRKTKRLRRELTDAERQLWAVLRNAQLEGAKFRRQQPIGPFIADFVCQDRKLVVEADGGLHHDNAADDGRTAFLAQRGYRVVRFWNSDIMENIEGVAASIAFALKAPHPALASRESPSPSRGEGNGARNG